MTDDRSSRLPPPPAPRRGQPDGGEDRALALARALARDAFGREVPEPEPESPFGPAGAGEPPARKEKAIDALGRRAGALADELDFPAFVASLVHGTFDAIVDSSIRQMESFADLVAAVAKPLDQFARENVTRNQARDWLAEQYPADVRLVDGAEGFTLAPMGTGDDFAEPPAWLADFGHEGEPLSPEFLEETLLPLARERVAEQRLSTLATMVLLGMNRVVVKDGTIGARLRFRAAAAEHAAVQYATGNDPETGVTEWGRRGSGRPAVTKVSTVGVNVQADTELKAELFGDVKINFASETVPLDRFINEAQRTLLERHSRRMQAAAALPQAPAAQPVSAVVQPVAQPVQPAAQPVAQPAPPPAAQPAPPAPAAAPAGGGQGGAG